MAEEVAAPVASAPVAEVSTPVAAAVSAPVIEQTQDSQVSEAKPVVEPSPAVVPVVEEAKPLLSPEAPEAKSVEPSAEAEKTESEPAPLPVYEFKLPEGTNADNPAFKAFNTKLGEFQNLSKAEQAAVQKFGQEMIDMHMEDVKSIVESQNKSAWDWFNNRNKEWLENSKKDVQIGGENWDSTLTSASQAISLYGGTKAQQLETAKLFQETGVENHPALLRFLSNITKVAAKEGSPVSSTSAPAQRQGIAQAMYGKTSGAA